MTLRHLLVLLVLSIVGLAACAGPRTTASQRPDVQVLRQRFGELPGVVLVPGEGLHFSYPGQVLFSTGAALPLAGGTALLDPLARLVVAHPDLHFRGTVRAATGVSPDYDERLARQRAALLQRYFRNRGVEAGQLSLAAQAGEGPSLELQGGYSPAAAASSASSSDEKR
jgi:hypothetical protein